jgi:hypothetical protein
MADLNTIALGLGRADSNDALASVLQSQALRLN